MDTSYMRGWPVVSIDGQWYYADDTTLADDSRPCPRCGKLPVDGMDACMADSPGIRAGCCGHGVHVGYISFDEEVYRDDY